VIPSHDFDQFLDGRFQKINATIKAEKIPDAALVPFEFAMDMWQESRSETVKNMPRLNVTDRVDGDKRLTDFLEIHELLDYTERLIHFYKIATPCELWVFDRLTECEGQSL
jgi:hypothetical protein